MDNTEKIKRYIRELSDKELIPYILTGNILTGTEKELKDVVELAKQEAEERKLDHLLTMTEKLKLAIRDKKNGDFFFILRSIPIASWVSVGLLVVFFIAVEFKLIIEISTYFLRGVWVSLLGMGILQFVLGFIASIIYLGKYTYHLDMASFSDIHSSKTTLATYLSSDRYYGLVNLSNSFDEITQRYEKSIMVIPILCFITLVAITYLSDSNIWIELTIYALVIVALVVSILLYHSEIGHIKPSLGIFDFSYYKKQLTSFQQKLKSFFVLLYIWQVVCLNASFLTAFYAGFFHFLLFDEQGLSSEINIIAPSKITIPLMQNIPEGLLFGTTYIEFLLVAFIFIMLFLWILRWGLSLFFFGWNYTVRTFLSRR